MRYIGNVFVATLLASVIAWPLAASAEPPPGTWSA
jgi:hypothetical protein